MIHLYLTTNQNAYDIVGGIIDKEAEKVFGNYNPCEFIVKLGYKYASESENERIIENEYYYNNDLDCYWENDCDRSNRNRQEKEKVRRDRE